ncbi:MAG: hypothetical protein ACYC55_04485 [Candidatus Geothermincolia bacterium]
MSNQLAQEVERILAAAVGEFIARATIRKNCELIGSDPDTLGMEELDELAEKIEKSVSFFSGKDVGLEVSEKIKALRR